jgi:predicted Zn-dependent protease
LQDEKEKRERRRFRIGTIIGVAGVLLAAMQVEYARRQATPAPSAPVPSTITLEEAIALASNGRTGEAMSAFQQLAAAEPRNPVVHANACGLYLQLNHLAQARQACQSAVLTGPTNWLAHYNNACVLALEGRTNEAIEALRRALATVGADTSARLTRTKLAEQASADQMLRSLRSEARFRTLIAAQQESR